MSKYLMMAALIIAAPASAQPAKGLAKNWNGVWQNQKGSVRIRTSPCGTEMCGTVIWATAEAKAKAADGGTEHLVGTQLFRNFRHEDDGLWYGEVYVPDLDKSVSGTIELADANTLIGTGCLFANIGCKSQTWKRVR